MSPQPERGIVITTAELASEGVDVVLDTVAATGATAITVTTDIIVPATPETGVREPPLDVAGEPRALDRPIWGERVAWVRHLAAHEADPALWRDLPWAPPELAPPEFRTDWARAAIEAARTRGLRAYGQFSPYQLPGATFGLDTPPGTSYQPDDYRPKRLVGGPHPEGIAHTGCLNHPAVRALGRTRLREHLRHYPDTDGISLTWVEYPIYFLEKIFTCFCDHCRAAAGDWGYDWDGIVRAARALWDSLHTLRPDALHAFAESGGDWGEVVPEAEHIQHHLDQWLRFKRQTVLAALADLRATMADAGAEHMHLASDGFPMPWARLSGAGQIPAGGPVDSQRVRLFSFHWLMMVNWWTTTALAWNRGGELTDADVIRAVLTLFDLELIELPDPLVPHAFGMPSGDMGHNLTAGSYTRRIEQARVRWSDQAPMELVLTAHRSPEDLAMVLEAVTPHAGDGLWIQRYGYLSDDKLAILRRAWTGT